MRHPTPSPPQGSSTLLGRCTATLCGALPQRRYRH